MHTNGSYPPVAIAPIGGPEIITTAAPNLAAPAERQQVGLCEGFDGLFHDLRTPLHSILASTELLEGDVGVPSEAVRSHLTRIRRAGDRLTALIDRILLHARLDNGEVQASRELILLPDLVQGVVEIVAPLAVQRGLFLDVQHTPAAYFTSDSGLIEQILLNLLGNAVKYTTAGGINLSCARMESQVEFEVSDSGVGISAEDLENVFAPFWRVPGSQKLAGGIGLGLSLVNRLVVLLGGTVEVESQLGVGTTFRVLLPVT